MNSIRKILFPTDFSEIANNAFRFALWLADQYQADIQLLHVVYPEVQPMDLPILVTLPTQEKVEVAKELMKTFVEVGLAQIESLHPVKEVPNIHSDIEIGAPAATIARVANRDQIDLVIMGTKGKHNRIENLFGSVTTDTLAKAECPVLVIPEDHQLAKIKTVGFATDLSNADPFHIWELSKLLYPFELDLKVIHVEQKKDAKKPLDLQAMESFFAEQAPALRISFHNIAGINVTSTLETFLEIQPLDLLVLYKTPQGFMKNIFHKSISKALALHTSTPLLIF